MASGKYAPPSLGRQGTKRFVVIAGVVVLAMASIVSVNRVSKEKRLAVEPVTKPPVQADAPSFVPEGELTFLSNEGLVRSRINIELAETDDERTRGLMYRSELAENQGMLFVFPQDAMLSFWMKNTPLPLDMFFVNDSLKIVTIHKMTKPFDQSNYPASEPARFVVEVNGGYADRHGIAVGERIRWQRF